MADTVVLYTLSLNGNLQQQLPQVADGLQKVQKAAAAATAAAGGGASSGSSGSSAGGLAGAMAKLGEAGKKMNQNQNIAQLETVSALFIQVGGNVSRLASITTSLIRPLTLVTTVFGGATLAAGGLLAAIAALPVAYYKLGSALGNAADEAEKRLEKLGRTAELPAGAVQSIRLYRSAQDELKVATDQLTVRLGEHFVPELTRASQLMLELTERSGRFSDSTGGLGDALLAVGTAGGSLVVGGIKGAINRRLDSGAQEDQARTTADRIYRARQAEGEKIREQVAKKKLEDEEEYQKNVEAGFKEQERQEKERLKRAKELLEVHRKLVRVAGQAPAAGSNDKGSFDTFGIGLLDKHIARLADTIPAWQAAADEIAKLPEKMEEAFRQIRRDAAAGQAAGILGAAQGGAASLVGGIAGSNPWGALIAGIISASKGFGDQGGQPGWAVALMDELADMPGVWVEQSQALFEALPEQIGKGIEHSGAIVALPINIVKAFVAESPAIFASLVEAMLTGPGMIVTAIADAFRDLPKDLAQAFKDAFSGLGGKLGDNLGIHLGAEAKAAGESRFLGVHIPKFDRYSESPGQITRTGLAVVHRGEQIGPSGSGGGVSIGQVHVHGVQDPQRFLEQLRAKLGTRGLGLSLEPYGGVG